MTGSIYNLERDPDPSYNNGKDMDASRQAYGFKLLKGSDQKHKRFDYFYNKNNICNLSHSCANFIT